MIGTCDCCEAKNVELSFGTLAGLETWSCYDGCKPTRKLCDGCDGHECDDDCQYPMTDPFQAQKS